MSAYIIIWDYITNQLYNILIVATCVTIKPSLFITWWGSKQVLSSLLDVGLQIALNIDRCGT